MAVAPRLAGTVVVLQDGAAGAEVLLVRRHGGSPFMPGATVFPGGKVDAADAQPGDTPLQTIARAVARELREEAGLSVGPGNLVPFANWLTPVAEPRRFDTWFFAVRAPDGQQPVHDKHETTDIGWHLPQAALDDHAKGGVIVLPPPTLHTLQRLVQIGGDVARLLAVLGEGGVGPQIMPHFVVDGPDGPTIALPWDPLHPDAASYVAAHGPQLAKMQGVCQVRHAPAADRFVLREARFARVWG